MIKSKQKYCYLDPHFPKEIFVVIIFLKTDRSSLILAPLNAVCVSEKEAILTISSIEENYKKLGKNIGGALLFQMALKQTIPLKKAYWDHPSRDFSTSKAGLKALVSFIRNPSLYQLLVLPRHYDRATKQWWLSQSVPFFISDGQNMFDKFMMSSNEIVDVKAKYAASYINVKQVKINAKTKSKEENRKFLPINFDENEIN